MKNDGRLRCGSTGAAIIAKWACQKRQKWTIVAPFTQAALTLLTTCSCCVLIAMRLKHGATVAHSNRDFKNTKLP